MSTPILDRTDSPAALRRLAPDEVRILAQEIRASLTDIISTNGGHLASNLGVVELTLALHRVFDFARDRLLFDVGHQCYTHKLITGRRAAFPTLRQRGGVTGFPNPRESVYDPFLCGHASTSISTAVGYATAFRIQNLPHQAVAVVGDGAIGGGMCFEALNHAGHTGENVLVILNDNEMAIAKTVGAFSREMTAFRSNPATHRVHDEIHGILQGIPLIGHSLDWLQERLLDALKNHTGLAAVFSAMGFHYFGPIDGHDLEGLERELHLLHDYHGPRLLHVATRKGHGFAAAAADPETFHSAVPFSIRGKGDVIPRTAPGPTYSDILTDALLAEAEADPRVLGITAAMPAGTGIKRMTERFPERLIDVGIAEAHAITYAAALARQGMKPVLAIYSTFLQRGYDQLFHDVLIQPDLPFVVCLDRAGLVGADGPTHHGVFDIAFLRHLPGITLMAPRDGEELAAMLHFALELGTPVAIRYPRGGPPDNTLPTTRTPLALGVGEELRSGTDGVVFAYGRMVAPALRAAMALEAEGISLGVVNARFAKPLDGERIAAAAQTGLILTVEDHALAGGFGGAVGEVVLDAGHACRVARIGIPDAYVEAGSSGELDRMLGLDPDGLQARFREEVLARRDA